MSAARAVSVVRELYFDPVQQTLLSLPTAELHLLRKASPLVSHGTTTVQPGTTFSVVGAGASVADVEIEVALGHPNETTSFSVGVLGGLHRDAAGRMGLAFGVTVSQVKQTRSVLVSGTCSKPAKGKVTPMHCITCPGTPFTVPAGETTLRLRVLVDRTVVEFFAGDGRAVCSSALARPTAERNTGVYIQTAPTAPPLTVSNATVWQMGCSFA